MFVEMQRFVVPVHSELGKVYPNRYVETKMYRNME